MSAALTMPGLFPLVGIVGEDDRDAFDLALQNVDPGAKNGPPEKKYGSHGSNEACASKRAPRASQGRKRCLCHSACNIDPRIAASANVTLMARMRSRLVGRAM